MSQRVQALGERFSAGVARLMPDPFVLVLTLTVVVFIMAFFGGEQLAHLPYVTRAEALATSWFVSLYEVKLMRFAMQMCIVLIAGHALAISPPVQRLIAALCGLAKSPRAAVLLVLLSACFASLLQWGLGVIVGALMAREMGKTMKRAGVRVHYPLLGAAGYAGFMVWHGGLSGSAPLKIAEKGHFLEGEIGVIPITDTIFGAMNVSITLSVIVALCVVCLVLTPSQEADEVCEYPGDVEQGARNEGARVKAQGGLIATIESGRAFSTAMALLLLCWSAWWLTREGLGGVNLNTINVLFLGLGLLFHRSARAYVRAVHEGVRGCAGVILQFPFYFGILGLLSSSGLIAQASSWLIASSGESMFGVMTFLSAGLVNLLVPSGGGQWVIQGPLIIKGATALKLKPTHVILAMCYGDAWTNLLQPFWALPLLGLMKLEAREIIGYTALMMLVTGPVIAAQLYMWG